MRSIGQSPFVIVSALDCASFMLEGFLRRGDGGAGHGP